MKERSAMLTERERDVINRWNDFYLRPREGSIEFQRKRLADYFEEFNTDLPEVGAWHDAVALKAGLTAAIAVPKGNGPFPVMLYIHGGAWTLGSAQTHRKLIRQFAEAGYLTIAPGYRLAPENPFPAGFDDCVFTAHWARENAARYGGDPSRLAMGGDSAGGNLTAAALGSIGAKPDAPRFRAAILIYGAFDFPTLYAQAREGLEPLARAYLGANFPAAMEDPRVSPIRAVKPGALPPSFLIVGAADGIVGETRSMAAALAKAGIEHELHVLDEMPHAFMQMNELSACRDGLKLMFDFMRRRI
jgi:acetyl esterase